MTPISFFSHSGRFAFSSWMYCISKFVMGKKWRRPSAHFGRVIYAERENKIRGNMSTPFGEKKAKRISSKSLCSL